jgi:hypothetical protein
MSVPFEMNAPNSFAGMSEGLIDVRLGDYMFEFSRCWIELNLIKFSVCLMDITNADLILWIYSLSNSLKLQKFNWILGKNR